MPSWLTTLNDRPPDALAGGKGAGLYRLLELGLPVPPFVVLTADAYRAACPDGRVPAELPAEAESVLDRAWSELDGAAIPLAVRSSAIDEDSAERSFAGQMDTFLHVVSRDALSAAVLGCWRSLHGARARAYRAAGEPAVGTAQAGAPASPVMAVVIQHMVEPDAAGVLFTVNPVTGREDEILVSSVWGLGEGLVSGALNADTFVLDRAGNVKTRQIADKREETAFAKGGGTEQRPVPDARAAAPSLGDAVLRELARLARQAEAKAGRPLDIEFAVRNAAAVFLQARPVTTFKRKPSPADGPRRVWDNSNIIESYPGITLPLTFSFIRRAYHAVYWQFCQVLGLSARAIRRHDPMLWNMLGLMRGRVYYNLLNWYRLVALLPGFRFNKPFMEGMMGLKHPEELDEPRLSRFAKYFRELPRLVRAGVRAMWLHASLQRRVVRFHRDFDAAYARFAAIDYARLQPAEIMARYFEMEEAVLWHWKAPIINDFDAMIFYGVLKRLTVEWHVDPDGSLQNALVSRQGQIESIRVVDQLLDVARRIAGNEELKRRFLAAQPGEARALLEAVPEVRAAFEEYLRHYGDRCIAELKLESRSMKDDPAFCMSMMQNYLRQSRAAPGAQDRAERALREDAEAQLAQRLAGKRSRLGFSQLRLYRWVLNNARAAIRNRENQRLARTRAFAVVRSMFRAVGRAFARDGLLGEPEDIFYVEISEIDDYVAGRDARLSFRGLVETRKAQYEQFRARAPLPEHFATYGDPATAEPVVEDEQAGPDSDVLRGLGACPGVVERPAVLLFEPDTSVKLDGEILVTRQTDPGWVLLFPSISGLVVERGSMLSHSAIVAREMGIPAVVGVPGATQRVKTGDRVRLDGAKGTVEVIGGR
ncbi:MAG: hypothetical protein JXR37_00800 [Kiritimatiellae bacterium]|nr:hypothetical protein [Kiritimatiellia bacterium]